MSKLLAVSLLVWHRRGWKKEVVLQMGEQQIVIRDRSWNVFEAGTGTPIVFLHNGGGSLWNWAHQLRHFSPRYRVVAPDLPGFGRSYRPSGPLTLDRYVEDLSELLERLECPRPILVGNCIGSLIALEYALRQPGKVTALALFNVCGGPPMLPPRLQFWASLRPRTAVGKALHRWIVNQAAHPRMGGLTGALIYADVEPELPPELVEFTRRQSFDAGLRASLHGLVMGLESFSVFSRPREKPDGFPPVLLGWGSQNRTLAVEWADLIAGWLAPDHFVLVENAGHMPMYEQPERINEALDLFIQSVRCDPVKSRT